MILKKIPAPLLRWVQVPGVVSAACIGILLFVPKHYLTPSHGISPQDHYQLRDHILMALAWAAAMLVYPRLAGVVAEMRGRWRPAYTAGVLAVTAAGLWAGTMHWGNRQFGAWDDGILIDTGWRQILGQQPYKDFLTPNPPGFNLGVKYAFQLFGVNWDAQLYLTVILTVVSLFWMYWLLLRLTERRAVAFWVALAVQIAVNLESTCWWYNNTSEIFAGLLFLSMLLLCREPRSIKAQLSYYFSLWPMALLKPNTAGLLIAGGFVLSILASTRRMRVLWLSAAAAVTAYLFLRVNHVSIPAMLACYHAAAIERGWTLFGLIPYHREDKVRIVGWYVLIALPVLTMWPLVAAAWRERAWRRLAYLMFFPLIAAITAYGLTTNNDFKDMEVAKLMAGGAVLLWGTGLRVGRPSLRRFYAAIICATMASDLHAVVARMRILGIGNHEFFEWSDTDHPTGETFFAHMRAAPQMKAVIEQTSEVATKSEGPVFFGPRLEMEYALTGTTPPRDWPVYWQPGTSFARTDTERLIQQVWERDKFKTLVFLKDTYSSRDEETLSPDFTYYPADFIARIRTEYTEDDSYANITVFRRHAP